MVFRHRARHVLVAGILLGFAGTAHASTLVYTPVDPAFGGSPLNSSYLLGVAGGINGYKDPKATNSQDPGALFVQQLQGQLLSALSTQITNVIFGPNAQQSGTITFGNETIAFVKGLESVHLTITNSTTGAVTSIDIPVLQTTTSGSSSSTTGAGG